MTLLDSPDAPAGNGPVPRLILCPIVMRMYKPGHPGRETTVATPAELLAIAKHYLELTAHARATWRLSAGARRGFDADAWGNELGRAESFRWQADGALPVLDIYDGPPGIGSKYEDLDAAADGLAHFTRWLGRLVEQRTPDARPPADAAPAIPLPTTEATAPAGEATPGGIVLPCPVALDTADGVPLVYGSPAARLTDALLGTAAPLVAAYPRGLTSMELIEQSGTTAFRDNLKSVERLPGWHGTFRRPGRGRHGGRANAPMYAINAARGGVTMPTPIPSQAAR